MGTKDTITKVLDRMPVCECGHDPVYHWHTGPADDLDVMDCGEPGCDCKAYSPKDTTKKVVLPTK